MTLYRIFFSAAVRQCSICQSLAQWECLQCYEDDDITPGQLKQYCNTCNTQVNTHTHTCSLSVSCDGFKHTHTSLTRISVCVRSIRTRNVRHTNPLSSKGHRAHGTDPCTASDSSWIYSPSRVSRQVTTSASSSTARRRQTGSFLIAWPTERVTCYFSLLSLKAQ